ncbi:MAG: pyridoxal phosphate-dependent aminotransferase family protein [Paludibacteraceae bacterium]|nr:pyridoxal phosphate-dependent aminotransferase family protein [Candidatus Physcocola equi]MCQ2233798.1 pyridoxal phosphate-dependent aminotransferase family protein [Paludibacteraceae bacterium]
MGLLQDKLAKYTEPQRVKELGLYPYFRAIETAQDSEVVMDGKKVLMFGSNSYMGLTNDPRIKQAAIEATQKYGTGCAGSRFLNGTLDIHVELEKQLAEYVGKESAICVSAGFNVNSGVIPKLVGPHDFIVYDELAHASIFTGIQNALCKKLKFKHNDMDELEKKLQKCDRESVKLIVVDGVYSMEGDVAKLPEIVDLAKKYDAAVYVDEAHGIGVFGKQGRGVCDHFGLTKEVDLIMGTFSKSLASIGGFCAGDATVMNWLRHSTYTYIFSASMTPAAAAAALKALEIIKNEPERQEHLWEITKYAIEGFRNLGFEIGHTETPIIPLFVRDNDKTFLFTKMAFDRGVFINPVVSPAVPPEDTLVRFSLMATNTKQQIDTALEVLGGCAKELGIIK